MLSGKYAFSFTGTATSTGNPLLFAGSFTADGAGNITAGVEDLDEISIGISKGLALSGNYSIGSDGRGTLNFISVSQTFKIVIENGGQIREFLARSADFAVIPPSETVTALWDKAEDFATATLQSAEGLLMTPRRTGTDGFFVSVLKKG